MSCRSSAASAALLRAVAGLLAGSALLAACSGVNEINVGPPRTAVFDSTASDPNRGSVLVELTATGEPYAEGVRSTRFRVEQVWLKGRDGQWIKRNAQSEPFRVGSAGTITRTILASQVPAVAYDSLALFLGDVYVEYGPTAGGVPTVRNTTPVTVGDRFTVAADDRTVVRLQYHAAPSITRDTTDGRWTFAPVIRPESPLRTGAGPSNP